VHEQRVFDDIDAVVDDIVAAVRARG